MFGKRFFIPLTLFFLITSRLFAAPVNQTLEYTLENGMQVFILEDSSDAQVHIEYTCRAGFSSQTQSTCGFFRLFSKLIKAANPAINFSDIQCNADSSRYFIEASPSEVNDILFRLSDAVFSPDFSDDLLSSQLNSLKKEVSDNANSMSFYINAAIDSRVFSEAPWKHDSGIYPPLFKKTTEKTARTILKQISEQWYTPKNSALFISGNINADKTLLMLRNSFGRFYSSFRTPVEKPSVPVNKQRKYVFHSNEISPELTQIVVQYTMLDMEESDLMALALGYESSLFKQQVLSFEELNIPGDEYINVSAAHKKDSSRLIIQTLLQPPENKKAAAATSSFKQASLFLKQLDLIPEIVRPEEFEYAKNQLAYSLNRNAAIPAELMKTLSSFWAVQPYYQEQETNLEGFESKTALSLMSRNQKLRDNSLTESISKLKSEEPFVFIIINSKDYKANKKSYTAAGFEEINEKNSSWYVQTMFKEMRTESETQPQTKLYTIKADAADNNYYQKNLDSISESQLSNGIHFYSKNNPLSEQTSLLLSIRGGKYNSNDDNGFEEVMINLLAGLIQKKLLAGQEQGLLTGAPYVTSKTGISSSQIIIEFDSTDTIAVCRLISDAIIYGEIAPADADRVVSSRKYRKRLENGTSSNQMYAKMIESVFGKGPLANIYEAEKEILLDTDYQKILAAYPALLDATRYTIYAAGNLDNNLSHILDESLGLLTRTGSQTASLPSVTAKKRDLTVKVNHTFLTDIPAEKAGPQPAVLIPTTEFLDPVIYAGTSPEAGTKAAALYNAVLSYLGTLLSKTDSSRTVTVQLPVAGINLGSITIQNVAHTKELDAQYKTAIQNITEALSHIQANEGIVRDIKNSWIQKQMTETGSNSGTAMLMQSGLETDSGAYWYLEEYNFIQEAEAQDFYEIMEYFPVRPQIRVYSADSKK